MCQPSDIWRQLRETFYRPIWVMYSQEMGAKQWKPKDWKPLTLMFLNVFDQGRTAVYDGSLLRIVCQRFLSHLPIFWNLSARRGAANGSEAWHGHECGSDKFSADFNNKNPYYPWQGRIFGSSRSRKFQQSTLDKAKTNGSSKSFASPRKEAYAKCATLAYRKQWRLYKFRPKYHLVCHIVRSLKICEARGADIALNPVCCFPSLLPYYSFPLKRFPSILNCHVPFLLGFGCWQDEDHIGRVSRLSRSCHPLLCSTRTMQKSLHLYMQQLKKLK